VSVPTVIHVAEMISAVTLCGQPCPLPPGHRAAVLGSPVVGITCDACRDQLPVAYARLHQRPPEPPATGPSPRYTRRTDHTQ
jgi:hypothetical protein